MVSPLMVRWCAFTNKKKHKWVIHLGTLGFFGWFAYICINYTYVLPVHGGGTFVCGGDLCNPVLCGYAANEQWSVCPKY